MEEIATLLWQRSFLVCGCVAYHYNTAMVWTWLMTQWMENPALSVVDGTKTCVTKWDVIWRHYAVTHHAMSQCHVTTHTCQPGVSEVGRAPKKAGWGDCTTKRGKKERKRIGKKNCRHYYFIVSQGRSSITDNSERLHIRTVDIKNHTDTHNYTTRVQLYTRACRVGRSKSCERLWPLPALITPHYSTPLYGGKVKYKKWNKKKGGGGGVCSSAH